MTLGRPLKVDNANPQHMRLREQWREASQTHYYGINNNEEILKLKEQLEKLKAEHREQIARLKAARIAENQRLNEERNRLAKEKLSNKIKLMKAKIHIDPSQISVEFKPEVNKNG